MRSADYIEADVAASELVMPADWATIFACLLARADGRIVVTAKELREVDLADHISAVWDREKEVFVIDLHSWNAAAAEVDQEPEGGKTST